VSSPLHFGVFEANLAAGELRKNGRTVKLQPQPFKLLALFLERPGELLTREEIHQKLWGDDTFVDFEQGLNFAVKKLREALGDDSARPRYIETVPRRGYRFIAPLERARGAPIPPEASVPAKPPSRVISISNALNLPHDALRPDTVYPVAMGEAAPPDLEVATAPVPRSAPIPVRVEAAKAKLAVSRRLIGIAALLAVAAALAVAWLLFLRPPAKPSAELTQTRLTFNSSEHAVVQQHISPDGKYLAYSDSAGIHLKLLSTGDERLIPRPPAVPAHAYWVATSWFPDDTQLLADATGPGAQPSTWLVSVLGQSARELHQDGVGLGVSPDGTRITFVPIDASGEGREIWVIGSQGGNPQRVLALGEGDRLQMVHWSPDGQRLGYIRVQRTPEKYLTSMETCDLKGANRTVVLRDIDVDDYSWLPDGRIVYSDGEYASLWQIGIDARSGTPAGKPKRITQWPGSVTGLLSASADGKRLTVQQSTYQEQVYVAELAAGGTHMSPPRRLVNDEASDKPYTWTADSKAVLFSSQRNGTWGIFKQGINQDTAEPAVAGTENASYPILSADGAWILYSEYPKDWDPSIPTLLMRSPVSGGVPQRVMELPSNSDYKCARAPASLCVLAEASQDKRQFTIAALDLRGRGKVLRTIPKDPTVDFVGRALSPDGTVYAISDGGESEIHVRLLSLSAGTDREFTVKGWRRLTGLDWSADGKGFYVGCVSPQARTLLYVDLKGNARVLWQYKGAGQSIWGIPSPDGRYLAILGVAFNSSVWMLEGF
jgi:DNA-binding winged helix-turn-helix (wHTH) protein/dipeptidyl aminopeptidase/acylaminoacyl peptidase